MSQCGLRHFYAHCPEDSSRHNVKMCICPITFSRPLIGQKRECYIVEEVIEVDEHDESNLKSSATGKKHE